MPIDSPPPAPPRRIASQDQPGTSAQAGQSSPVPASGWQNWLGGLGGLRRRRASSAPQGPLHALPQHLLVPMVEHTINGYIELGRSGAAASQLATLRLVNKAFREAADTVQQQRPDLRRTVLAERTGKIIKAALREWNGHQPPASLDRLREMDHVVVDLRLFEAARPARYRPGMAASVAREFRSALHHGHRTLEVVAAAGTLLNDMMQWLECHPDVILRSLDVQTTRNTTGPVHGHTLDAYASLDSPSAVGRALRRQNNLAELTLWHGRPGHGEHNGRLSLQETGLAEGIGLQRELRTLSLCNVGKEPAALTSMLRGSSRLEVLNLVAGRRTEPGLDAAAFAPVVSALKSLHNLRCLQLDGILPDGTTVESLADAVSGLLRLQTLKLARAGFNADELGHLVRRLRGLEQLQTVDFEGQPVPLEAGAPLIQALAELPALRCLRLNAPAEKAGAATMASILGPLSQRRGLQLHLHGWSESCLRQLRAALPDLFSARDHGSRNADTDWSTRLRHTTIVPLNLTG
jgi:hypothetical protein